MSLDPLLDSEGVGRPMDAELGSVPQTSESLPSRVATEGRMFRARPAPMEKLSILGKSAGLIRECSRLAYQAAIPKRYGGNGVELRLVGDTPGNNAFKVRREVLPEIVLTINGNPELCVERVAYRVRPERYRLP